VGRPSRGEPLRLVRPRARPQGQRETLSILAAEFAAAAEAVQARTRDLLTLFEVDRSIRAEGNLAASSTRCSRRWRRASAPPAPASSSSTRTARCSCGPPSARAAAGRPPGGAAHPDRRGRDRARRGRGEASVVSDLTRVATAPGDAFLRGAGSATLLPLLAGDGAATGTLNAIGLVV
jgi:hypothetical protein